MSDGLRAVPGDWGGRTGAEGPNKPMGGQEGGARAKAGTISGRMIGVVKWEARGLRIAVLLRGCAGKPTHAKSRRLGHA